MSSLFAFIVRRLVGQLAFELRLCATLSAVEEQACGARLDVNATTSGRLRQVAMEAGERPAVVVDDQVTTYAELDRAADELAAALLRDLGPGDHRIGLRSSGTLPMVLGAAATSRAGMVSVPIDPTAPPERLRFLLDDVGSPLLLSDTPLEEDIGRPTADPLTLKATPPPGGVENPQGPLASIVFTSGSTGVPKGIMVPREHRMGLSAKFSYLADMPDGVLIGALAAGTVGIAEPLVHGVIQLGATLNAYEVRRLGIAPMADWLVQSRVAGFATVPTIVRLLSAALPADLVFEDIQMIVLTGETTTWEDISALRPHLRPETIIYNLFGLTETNMIALYKIDETVPSGESGPLPAGLPVPTCRVSIVDEGGRPVPPGERGEIVVSGEGCALGYWGRPELTAQIFSLTPDGERRVKTGDAGRFRPDGLLEHLGRLDHLVKIAGNRVELGEVESALCALDGVLAAVAAAYTDNSGATRLTAFVVGKPGAALEPWVLRSALARRLPGPMLPDHISVVNELPRLANGKVDRQVLAARAPEAQRLRSEDASGLELAIRDLFCAVLDRADVGLDDNFFELGGDSLRAARLFTDLEHRLGMDRPVAIILEAPTVRSLAATVAAGERGIGLLVPLATNGARPPLFIVHDGMGDIFYAHRIAAGLGPDQPVYAVQPALIYGASAPERSIEQLASRYLADIRRLQPQGPYFFYGYSLGGLISFEMALQLQAAGQEVAFLGMGDSSAPVAPLKERARSRFEELRQLPCGQQVHLLSKLGRNFAKHGAELVLIRVTSRQRRAQQLAITQFDQGEPWEVRGRSVMWAYGSMALDYHPRTTYRGNVVLIRAQGVDHRADRGWKHFVNGEVLLRDADCTHEELPKEPHAQTVVQVLRQALGLREPSPLAGGARHSLAS